MQKEIFLDMIAQNQMTVWAVFDKVTPENAGLRLNEQTASAGFIYRHVGETINLFGYFFGLPMTVQNTTMGQLDQGQGQDTEASRQLLEQGYARFKKYVEETPDAAWSELIDTPFFGPVSRVRLFSHVLFHTSYHAGQVALTLARGGA
ncbi:DinB family protein [Spirosoma aerophilum]